MTCRLYLRDHGNLRLRAHLELFRRNQPLPYRGTGWAPCSRWARGRFGGQNRYPTSRVSNVFIDSPTHRTYCSIRSGAILNTPVPTVLVGVVAGLLLLPFA